MCTLLAVAHGALEFGHNVLIVGIALQPIQSIVPGLDGVAIQ